MPHPSGCLCSLPRNRPVAWFPASARWHVFRFPVSVPPCFSGSKFRHQFSPSVLRVLGGQIPAPKIGQMARLPKSELGLCNRSHISFFCLFEMVTTSPSSNEDPPSPSTHARPRSGSGIDFDGSAWNSRGDLLLGFQRLHIRLWHGRRHMGGSHHK